ncbi:MAG: cytochrome C, partial [Rhodocyclaceae bacterium]|nr:cytochrome C [Rhodocyclaceae bacterium]
MKIMLTLALTAALFPAIALAGPPPPKAAGIEAKDYQWGKMEGELKEALAKKGNIKRGKDTYEICGACHLPNGAGRPDGTFPQLAGQHTTV